MSFALYVLLEYIYIYMAAEAVLRPKRQTQRRPPKKYIYIWYVVYVYIWSLLRSLLFPRFPTDGCTHKSSTKTPQVLRDRVQYYPRYTAGHILTGPGGTPGRASTVHTSGTLDKKNSNVPRVPQVLILESARALAWHSRVLLQVKY